MNWTDETKKAFAINTLKSMISYLENNETMDLKWSYNFDRDLKKIYGDDGMAIDCVPAREFHRSVDMKISFRF